MNIDTIALESMEQRTRANLINGLSGYKSANLLGTVNADGETNLALMSSVFHVGANPPLMGMLMRPHSVPRHSLENILDRGSYTLNAVSQDMYQKAHQTSARYPREISEFDAVGFVAEYSSEFPAPYVAQSPVQIGLALVENHTLTVNSTVLLIGEIKEIRLADGVMGADGHLDLCKARLVALSGLDEYHLPSSLQRLPYPKPT